MPIGILSATHPSVKMTITDNCVESTNFEIDFNDFLESIEILVKYIKKRRKNKLNFDIINLMPNNNPTPHVLALVDALKNRGVDLEVEYWDGHKHIDIYIQKDNLYIEVDGIHHITRPETIISDLNRDYFSFKDGHFTKHITNEAIDTHLEQIADAIAHIAENAPNKLGEKLLS